MGIKQMPNIDDDYEFVLPYVRVYELDGAMFDVDPIHYEKICDALNKLVTENVDTLLTLRFCENKYGNPYTSDEITIKASRISSVTFRTVSGIIKSTTSSIQWDKYLKNIHGYEEME